MSEGISGAGPHIWGDNDDQKGVDPREADESGGGSHSKPGGHVGDDLPTGGASGTQPAAGVGQVSPGLAAQGYQRGPQLSPEEALRAGVPEGNPYWAGNEIKVAGHEPAGDDAEGSHPG